MTEHETADAAWGETTTAPLVWRSGRWRLELRDDELADIRFDDSVTIRSIRGVARDRDWGTIPPVVTGVGAGPERLTVDVTLLGRDADLAARLVVEARGDELEVRWECTAHADFLRNRLGLVVLHPPRLAGEELLITHPGGDVETTAYPQHIGAHQPAFEIERLSWRAGGVATSVEFGGDVFEMEDQRNWTDASFKTYSTPLSLPFPVRVAAGETVAQSVRLACAADAPAPEAHTADRVELVAAGRPFPAVGVSASTGPAVPPPVAVGGFLLVELPAHTAAWRAVLERAAAEAGALPLDVRIVGATPAVLEEVLDAIAPLNLLRVGVFTADTHGSEAGIWDALVAGLERRGLAAPTVGGTRAHFAELNRTLHRLPSTIPAQTVSITPQMHATGREQIVESIAMQRLVAQNAVRITGTPVHIGPVTLRSRFNAVATTPTPDAGITDLRGGYGAAVNPDATDPRQSSPAVLAWTVASAAALAVDGVESVTWFEASGPRGLRDGTGDDAFPVATALDWLGGIAGAPLLHSPASPDGIWAVGALLDGAATALVANLRAVPATVTVATPLGEQTVRLAPFSAQRLRHG